MKNKNRALFFGSMIMFCIALVPTVGYAVGGTFTMGLILEKLFKTFAESIVIDEEISEKLSKGFGFAQKTYNLAADGVLAYEELHDYNIKTLGQDVLNSVNRVYPQIDLYRHKTKRLGQWGYSTGEGQRYVAGALADVYGGILSDPNDPSTVNQYESTRAIETAEDVLDRNSKYRRLESYLTSRCIATKDADICRMAQEVSETIAALQAAEMTDSIAGIQRILGVILANDNMKIKQKSAEILGVNISLYESWGTMRSPSDSKVLFPHTDIDE